MKAKIINSKLTHEIRGKILWPHILDGDYSIAIDDHPNTFHIGTFLHNKIISVGTFIRENNSIFKEKLQYRLRAMATDNRNQGQGAGKILFLKGVELLKKKKIELLWCDARINAIPFYESLSMKSRDKLYMIKNIGMHKTMYIHLNK